LRRREGAHPGLAQDPRADDRRTAAPVLRRLSGPGRTSCRFLAAAKLRLAASSVGAMALPLHPPCVLASLAFRAPESRQDLRPEPLPGLEEDPQPVAQEAGHEEVRAHVLLAVATERLAQRRVAEDLQRPL